MTDATRKAFGAVAFMAVAAIVAGTWQKEHGLFNATMAAWAQAIGSVAAIFAAIHAATIPVRAEEKRRNLERWTFLDAVDQGANAAAQSLIDINSGIAGRNGILTYIAARTFRRAEMITLRGQMRVPIERWPTALLFSRCEALLGAIDELIEYTTSLANADYDNDTWAVLSDLLIRCHIARMDLGKATKALR